MNDKKSVGMDDYRSLMLLDEIAKGENLSQRDLSKRLNIALGLVNSYIKNLIAKGYITVSNIPAKRYTYYLTPKGFTEKTYLAYKLLQDYTKIYKEARKNFRKLFNEMSGLDIKKVSFAGADEVAEIAYLSLQEVDIELVTIFDDRMAGKKFFKKTIYSFDDIKNDDIDAIVLTTFLRKDDIYRKLLEHKIPENKIYTIYRLPNDDYYEKNGRKV